MRKKLIVTLILSIPLWVVLAMVVYAQGPGGDREPEEGGVIGDGLSDPPPVGFTVLYTFTGARDTQAGGTNSGATSVHCTNAGAANVQVRVEISDFDNAPTISGTLTIPPSGTRTYSSQDTNLYIEDFTMSTTDNIDQGSGRVMANSSSAKVICTAQVLDPVGNPPNYAVKLTLYDRFGNFYNAPPTVVSSVRADPDPTNAASVNFIVTFSEEVTGVDASDFSLVTTGSISGASVTGVIGSGAIYTVSVNTGVGSGTLRLDVPVTATITDLAGYPLASLPYTSGEAYTFDALPTVVSSVRADPDPTNVANVNFIVTFSEEVTGVDASDFSLVTSGSISGASLTGVSGSGAIYTVSVNTGVGSGTLRLDVPVTATITDLAGYPLAGLPYTSGEAYTVSVLAKIYLPLTLRIAP